MSGDIDFGQHLEAYLAIRDALGLTAGTRARLLRSFLDHARGATAPGIPIRATTAIAWACDHAPPGCGDAGKAHRLTVAREDASVVALHAPEVREVQNVVRSADNERVDPLVRHEPADADELRVVARPAHR